MTLRPKDRRKLGLEAYLAERLKALALGVPA